MRSRLPLLVAENDRDVDADARGRLRFERMVSSHTEAWAPPDHALRKISDIWRLAADQGFSIHMNVRCSKEVVLASSLRKNLHSSKRVGRAQDHDRSWLAKSAGHEIRFRVSTRQLPAMNPQLIAYKYHRRGICTSTSPTAAAGTPQD